MARVPREPTLGSMPYLGSTFFVGTLIIALGLGMVGFFALSRALWPAWIQRTRERWSDRPVRTTLTGFAVAVPAVTVCIVIAQGPGPLSALGGIAIGLLVGLALVGMAGLATYIGARLSAPGDAGRTWVQTIRGGVVLELSCLLPILGWFVVFPIALLGGLGAAILGWRRPNTVVRGRRATQPMPEVVNARAA